MFTDTVAYFGMAENIRAGKGPTFPFTLPTDNFDPSAAVRFIGEVPSTHFPPLYSAVLAVCRALGFSFVDAVRAIGPVMAALSLILFWTLAKRIFDGQSLAPVLATLSSLFLFVVPSVWLFLHGTAMSESVFVPLMLAVLLVLAVYVDRPSTSLAVGAGVLCSLALLTRDLGLTLVFTGAVVILVVGRRAGVRARLRRMATFVGVAISGPAAFTLWAFVQSGGSASRSVAWHPQHEVTNRIPAFVGTMFAGPLPRPWNGVLALVLLVGIPVLVYLWPERLLGPRRVGVRAQLLMLMGFVVAYLASLEVSRTLFDASTPVDRRLLGPVAAPLYLAVFVTAWLLLSATARRAFWAPVVVVGALVLIALVSAPEIEAEKTYNHRVPAAMEAALRGGLPLVERVPDDAVLFASEPLPVWSQGGRSSIGLPRERIATEDAENPRYMEQMCEVPEIAKQRPTYAYIIDPYIGDSAPLISDLRKVADLDVVAVDARTSLFRVTGPAAGTACTRTGT